MYGLYKLFASGKIYFNLTFMRGFCRVIFIIVFVSLFALPLLRMEEHESFNFDGIEIVRIRTGGCEISFGNSMEGVKVSVND